MKVAVCSAGDTLDSPVDPRFGRCAYFVVVDNETFEDSAVANPGATSAQGAGIQATQAVSSLGVLAVIASNLGPNAHEALAAAGIRVYQCAGETVRHAVDFFNAGALEEVTTPTVASHFGITSTAGQGFGRGRGSGSAGHGNRGRGRW